MKVSSVILMISTPIPKGRYALDEFCHHEKNTPYSAARVHLRFRPKCSDPLRLSKLSLGNVRIFQEPGYPGNGVFPVQNANRLQRRAKKCEPGVSTVVAD